jgi:hypothetical protein
MPSPICEVREGAGPYGSTLFGVDVSPGSTVTVRLADQSDVASWSLLCVTTDDANDPAIINAGLAIDSPSKTATFTAPANGSALRFRSLINNGIDANGVVDDDYEATFCVYVPTPAGRRVIAADETTEGHPDFGWVESLNKVIRGHAVVTTDDAALTLARRYPVADGDVRLVRATIKVQSADGSGAVQGEWDVRAAYARVAGVLAQAYAPVVTAMFSVGAPGGPALALNGDTAVDLLVTGVPAAELVWTIADVAL